MQKRKRVISKVKESNSKLNEGENIADNMIDLVLGSVLKNVSSKNLKPQLVYTMTRKKIIQPMIHPYKN